MTVKPNQNAFLPMKVGVGGFFHIEKRKAESGLITGVWDFHNNVTDAGLDLMATAPTFAYGFAYPYNACKVGTGNTAPSNSDTSLVSPIASAGATDGADGSGTQSYVAGPPAYWQMVRTYQFGTGVAAGNIAELGIYCSQDGTGTLFCRELVRDGAGNPTTITVLSDEILIVTYTLRFYLDTTDYAGSVTIGGTAYAYTRRMMDIDTVPSINTALRQNSNGNAVNCYAYNGSMGTVTTAPSGSSVGRSMSLSAYSPGSKSLVTSVTFGVNDANWSPGITVLSVQSCFHKYQFGFGTAIPKTVGQQLTVRFTLSWDRYAP